jgi:hypothetical protein
MILDGKSTGIQGRGNVYNMHSLQHTVLPRGGTHIYIEGIIGMEFSFMLYILIIEVYWSSCNHALLR